MSESPGIIVSIVTAAFLLAAGAYVIAVSDRWAAGVVAGQRPTVRAALVTPLTSAALLLVMSRTTTERPDGPGWALAPALLAALAALAISMVPLAPGVAMSNPDTGFVVFSAAIAFVMIAVFLHGWSPNSVLPLHGAYRYGAQALSFQIPFLLAMLATALPAESLSLVRIVDAQAALWNVIREPLGLPLYLVAGLAVSFWGPLNLPDGEDLGGGTSAEDAGIARLLWSAARSAMLVAVAAMGAAAFLGGYHGPVLPGPVWVVVKTLLLLALIVGAGHVLARMRIQQFVVLCWVLLIPLALLNVFVSGAFLL
ncbi:MAG TPA: NADH-quinone oxidoreductase subunit H [Candidatus Limnocylindrales bacterium]